MGTTSDITLAGGPVTRPDFSCATLSHASLYLPHGTESIQLADFKAEHDVEGKEIATGIAGHCANNFCMNSCQIIACAWLVVVNRDQYQSSGDDDSTHNIAKCIHVAAILGESVLSFQSVRGDNIQSHQ